MLEYLAAILLFLGIFSRFLLQQKSKMNVIYSATPSLQATFQYYRPDNAAKAFSLRSSRMVTRRFFARPEAVLLVNLG
jgi:hypothetical protein